jgi:NTP pyrophosphatase (non-canonical NTP hydrolase)
MELNDYQRHAESTAIYPHDTDDDGINYCILGLVGEAGELANKWKKYYRDGLDLDDVTPKLRAELGDVLWYVANLSAELGMDLSDVAEENIDKLKQRQEAGTLQGSGDIR